MALSGLSVPRFDQLPDLRILFNLGLTEFLSGVLPGSPSSPSERGVASPAPVRRKARGKYRLKRFDAASTAAILEACLRAGDEQRIPSLEEICRQHGWTTSTLRQHLPGLCTEFTAGGSAQRSARRRRFEFARAEALREEIRKVVRDCRRLGQPVTPGVILANLKQPGMLRAPWAREVRRDVLGEPA